MVIQSEGLTNYEEVKKYGERHENQMVDMMIYVSITNLQVEGLTFIP